MLGIGIGIGMGVGIGITIGIGIGITIGIGIGMGIDFGIGIGIGIGIGFGTGTGTGTGIGFGITIGIGFGFVQLKTSNLISHTLCRTLCTRRYATVGGGRGNNATATCVFVSALEHLPLSISHVNCISHFAFRISHFACENKRIRVLFFVSCRAATVGGGQRNSATGRSVCLFAGAGLDWTLRN